MFRGDCNILGMRIDPVTYEQVVLQVTEWAAQKGESRYVCIANVHMIMESHDHPDFRAQVNAADLVTPDGMPLVWMMRWMGVKNQQRVYGPELTVRLAGAAAEAGVPIGLYGGSPAANQGLAEKLVKLFPRLRINYQYSPPFRGLNDEEERLVVEEINSSGIRILFVGLGCPKQERWMAEHKGKVKAVMLGVGAAFDIHSGLKPQAPPWMQKIGMEWFFRLVTEPRRLWKRYLYHNPRFIFLSVRQLIGSQIKSHTN